MTMGQSSSLREFDIAIIGMAGRFPRADNADKLWDALKGGKDCITRGAQIVQSDTYVNAFGVIKDIDRFDADFFGIPATEAINMAPQQRILMETFHEAMENSGYVPETYDGLIGLFCGTDDFTYLWQHYDRIKSAPEEYAKLKMFNEGSLTGRLSYKFNLRGPSVVSRTACSTSLTTVHLACQSLLHYESDIAVAGGVSITQFQDGYYPLEGALSDDGFTRAYDENSSGFVKGNGAGLVVLKRLEEAVQDRDHIYAVIKGSAINNDGSRKAGFTAPSVQAQVSLIRRAIEMAGVHPEDIQYIEGHGTATTLGDAVELKALKQVFQGNAAGQPYCAIGSIKSNVGHLNIAAGIAGLIKTTLMIKHGMLVPSLYCSTPNAELKDSPFYVNGKLQKWESGKPRLAGVSSFGIGGANAHIILEEEPAGRREASGEKPQILIISARTEQALLHMSERLAEHMDRQPDLQLQDAAYTLQIGRKQLAYRRFLVGGSWKEMQAVGDKTIRNQTHTVTEQNAPDVIFMFPGGGSQYIQAGQELYQHCFVFREELNLCAALLEPMLDANLMDRLYGGSRDEEPMRLDMEMAAIFSISYAMARTWIAHGVTPSALIGHSLGEYAAACISGIFSLKDALFLVVQRARLFERLDEGAMLSVSLSEEKLRPLLAPGVSIAAINAPERLLVTGSVPCIEEFAERLQARDIAYSPLAAKRAGHSEAVASIIEPFRRALEQVHFGRMEIPIISTLYGRRITDKSMQRADYWLRQMRECVRFGDGVREAAAQEHVLLLEVGPGNQLALLANRQLKRRRSAFALSSLVENRSSYSHFLHALGQLWLRGAEIKWEELHRDSEPYRVPLPTYPFERQRYWKEAKPMPSSSLHGASAYEAVQAGAQASTELWKQALPPEEAPAPDAELTWLVIMPKDVSGMPLAKSLAGRLAEDGQFVIEVRAHSHFRRISSRQYEVDFTDEKGYLPLLEELHQANNMPARIVYLGAYFPEVSRDPSPEDAEELVQGLLHLCSGMAAYTVDSSMPLFVVTHELQPIIGVEEAQAIPAAVIGACSGLAEAYSWLRCLSIDVSERGGTEQLAGQIAAEWYNGPEEGMIGWRGNKRWIAFSEPIRGRGKPSQGQEYQLLKPFSVSRLSRFAEDALPSAERIIRAKEAAHPAALLRDQTEIVHLFDHIGVCCAAAYFKDHLLTDGKLTYAMEEIFAKLGVIDRFRSFVSFLINCVAEAGLAAVEKDEMIVFAASIHDVPRLESVMEQLPAHLGELKPYMELLLACASQYDAVFRGDRMATEVLYPEGQFDLLYELNRRLPEYSKRNLYVAAVPGIVADLARGAARKLRILEIGGGTGLLTWPLLSALKQQGIDVEYHFTDIGQSFVARAEAQAQRLGYSFVTCSKFDISKDPEAQGIEPNGYDMVISLNVVQATADMEASLRHLNETLAPGGLLFLVQTMYFHPLQNFIFGLSPGWWNYQQDPLREDKMLLAPAEWAQVLERSAYDRIAMFPPAGREQESDVHIIMAHRRYRADSKPNVMAIHSLEEDWIAWTRERTAEPSDEQADVNSLKEACFQRLEEAITGFAGAQDTTFSVFIPVPPMLLDETSSMCESIGGAMGLVEGVIQASKNWPNATFFLGISTSFGIRSRIITCVIQRAIDNHSGTGWALLELPNPSGPCLTEETWRIAHQNLGRAIRITAAGDARSEGDSPLPAENAIKPPAAGARSKAKSACISSLAAVPFRNDTERLLYSIFEDVLGEIELGTEDSYFDIGFDSLSGLMLSSKIRSRFHVGLTIKEMYRHSTIRELADYIDGLSPAPSDPSSADQSSANAGTQRGSKNLNDLLLEINLHAGG
ncbi:type I polyketide synthase [Paenibacillus dendritiformis]|uniref:type I polyketide synthase n=1 Tax=Paenibacillus dendritiformis TaxID=130049 RepID=UPI0018CF180E|nr:type I polyketide synthase [Paenibacillus dendritiformis]